MFKCSSCGIDIIARKNFVKFPCPSCGNKEIVRCFNCKTASSSYSCPECNFVGP